MGSESRSPRKSRLPLRAPLSLPSSPSSQSEEDIGVTRSETSIPSPVRLQARLDPSVSSSFPHHVELVLSVLPSPRSSFNSLVSMMFTPQPQVTLEHPRISSKLPSPLPVKPTVT